MTSKNKKKNYRQKPFQMSIKLRWALRLGVFCLSFAALSALFVVGYRSLLTSPVLRVARIQVSGCQHLDPQTVIEQAAIPSGVNILVLDLNVISRRLTNHPWVARAVIGREIPDRIRIEIEERRPMALVRGHQFFLVDAEGMIFADAAPSQYSELPIISGIDPETLAPGRRLPQELTVLIDDLYRECRLQLPWRLISEIRWNRNYGLTLFTVRGGIQINLGRGTYGPRMARLGKVLRYLEEKRAHNELRGIDLSHGDRVFVKGNFRLLRQQRLQQRGV
ncbi:MAG: FtsQ-type POTRA domain-containing protein [Deltaproteobacteria bacterium]|nr:MAG: FtsQ-type POTRA domain-containing protein [Deltaproteobacteria bacterium]